MVPVTVPSARITVEAFLSDAHAARYRDVVRGQPEAFARVLDIVSEPEQQPELLAAARYGHPALAGIVQADVAIAASLKHLMIFVPALRWRDL